MINSFKKSTLILALFSLVSSIHSESLEEFIADSAGSTQATLIIGGIPPVLDVTPIDEAIVITSAAQVPEGYTSYRVSMNVSSASLTGYHVQVHAPNPRHTGPGGCFRMLLHGSSEYVLDFEVLADEAPDGSPTPVHHHGFGPPQGGTAHLNHSKIVNAPTYDPGLRDFGLHFFIFNGQFKTVPSGQYTSTLILNLTEY
ncbi:hypothetical protein COB21_00865 [Candidatus Aerophobetes bacterium]|uniref:Uncharacterized protein n=1 Tax=Aerophobetes bacterium TaxID=2030807 RepID=A0A2A4X8L8_UNCAE|nr:MAG: hypothetical protein COB21_00865 [Candidatus Aerophobetes bacterium]